MHSINDKGVDLDIVMPMYNLLECSKNYSKTTGSLWNYYRDEPNSGAVGNINYSIRGSKSFGYKSSITGKLEGNNTEKEKVEIVVPLKHLSNFWKTLKIPLINCETNLILTWSEKCVITSKATRVGVGDNRINYLLNATFKITDTKLYIAVNTLSTQNDNKLSERLRTGFKRTVT